MRKNLLYNLQISIFMPIILPLLQSDDRIINILKTSNQYLNLHDEVSSKISNALRVFVDVQDLTPFTLERLFTGYKLPISEANIALENSIQFCKLGFYKQALTELRSALEMGLLSVYWELNDKGHIEMQHWLYSNELTPSIKKIIKKLTTNKNIKTFNDKCKFSDDIINLHEEMSRFVHTRGKKYSHNYMAGSNVNRFKEKAFSMWLDLFLRVVNVIVIAYVLKYPVALQHTPLYQKFGLNVPLGICLDIDQSEALRKFLDIDVLNTLQAISDSDVEAVGLAQQINDEPDLPFEQLQQQLDEFDKEHPEMKPPNSTVNEKVAPT